ncbi:MAG: clostripain-related cysteine peptidase, partial [Planctomycetota bacterium]
AITQAGVPLQVLAYDACLMGMVEQAYEARELATVQLASEEVIDGPGYNYRTVFQALNSNPQAVGATALAQGMVSSFTASYGSDGFSTFSAVASASVTGVTTALRAFTTASGGLTSANLTAVRSILAGVTRFDFPENIDLKQFMQRVSTTTSLPASVRAAAASVVTAVDQTVFSRMADSRQTGGLAIYLPSSTAQESSAYGLFTGFDAATGWSGFVNRLLGRTTSTRLGSGAGLLGMATRGIHPSGIGAQTASPEFPGRILANALSPVNAVRPQLEAQVLPRASSVGHGRPPEVFVASTEPARSPALVASARREAAVDAMFVSSLDEGFVSAI